MLPEIGHKFGPYEILGKLGAGGMGVVFRAWDDRLHREVAVKLLHDEFQAPGMRQRFLLEARAASALNHPHICTIFDMGEQDGEPFLVMENLEGITLKERILQGACFSEEIVRFGTEIAEALSAAHAKGIVHRDIKPANIFLHGRSEGSRQVKVLDFGLAKVSMALRSGRDSRALELTSAGSTVGTLAYMSPEQARGESLDTRSDLFSLGIVMYEMATRRTPFPGATTALAFQALLTQTPDPIRTWNVAIPRELERIIMRLLAKDRSARFQAAREVAEALQKLAIRGDGDWLRKLPRPEVPLVPSADPVARRPRRLRPGDGSAKEYPKTAAEAGSAPPEWSEHDSVLRPRRMPTPESRPRNISVAETSALVIRNDASVQPSTPSRGTASSGATASSQSPAPPAPPAEGEGQPSKASNVPPKSPTLSPAIETLAVRGPVQPVSEAKTGDSASSFPRVADLVVPSTARISADAFLIPPLADVPEATPPSGSLPGEEAGPDERPSRSPSPEIPASAPIVPKRASASHRFSSTRQPEAASTIKPIDRAAATRLRTWIMSAGGLALILFGLGIYLQRSGSFRQIVLAPSDTVLLTPVVNRTGDATLDNIVAEGLQIELAQPMRVRWLGLSTLRAGQSQVALTDHIAPNTVSPHLAAQRLGARAFLYGELSRGDDGFTIRIDVIDVASNDRLGSVTEHASQRNDLLDAITRLSVALRARVGESSSSDKSQLPTPLRLQATSNLTALNIFAQAEAAYDRGERSQTAALYRQAVTLAPDFTLAQLRLAELYARDGAEVPAARLAAQALASSSRTGPRVAGLAQVAAASLSDEDPVRAATLARHLLNTRPQDELALIAMAQVMRRQGHMTEALLTAQQAYRLYPLSASAYSEAALALIGLDRYQEALALDQKALDLGLSCDCGADIAHYLKGDSALSPSRPGDLHALFNHALALDDSGHFDAATVAWRLGIREAESQPEMTSAAAGMLAQAAFDRALANRCAEVPALVHEVDPLPYGHVAAYHLAVAGGLCSTPSSRDLSNAEAHLLEDAHLHSTSTQLVLPLVSAAKELAVRQPMQALAALSKAQQERDELPDSAYLRGLAHQLNSQDALASADFTQAARHHGYAFLSRTTVAPLATRRLADLLAASADPTGSGTRAQERSVNDRTHPHAAKSSPPR